jgi:putative transposase
LDQDGVILYAYVCLENHIHLLVETPLANIDRFMQRLNTAYSMYFRYKHSRPGHSFQGRYGARLVSGDEYLVRLTRYIHLNPIRKERMKTWTVTKKKEYLNRYAWSSYRGYVDKEYAEEDVDYKWLELMGRRSMRGRRDAYRRYVEGVIAEKDDVLEKGMGAGRYAIGAEEFCEEVAVELKEARLRKGCFGRDVTWPSLKERTVQEVEDAVVDVFGVERRLLKEHGRRAGPAKMVALELCCEFTDNSQRQIGVHFGYTSNGAVGKQRQKLRELMAEDVTLCRRMRKLRKQLASA